MVLLNIFDCGTKWLILLGGMTPIRTFRMRDLRKGFSFYLQGAFQKINLPRKLCSILETPYVIKHLVHYMSKQARTTVTIIIICDCILYYQ